MMLKAKQFSKSRDFALRELSQYRGTDNKIGSFIVGALPLFKRTYGRKNPSESIRFSRVGTRYIVIHPEIDASWAIDVSARRKGSYRMNGLYDAWKARALIETCQRAELALSASQSRYNPRILRMYGRVSEILWLHSKSDSGSDFFVAIHGRKPSEACQRAHGIEDHHWIDA